MAFGQPNYYSNPYAGGYVYNQMNSYQQPAYQSSQISQPIISPPTTPSQPINQPMGLPMISGKIVENYEMVKVSEIPIGGYGVFPLADSSKVYIKMYDKDGNPQTYSYALEQSKEILKEDPYSDKLSEIYDYIALIDKKMDEIKPVSPTSTTRRKKVEVKEDE